MYSNKADKKNGIIYGQTGKLKNYKSSHKYPGKIRRVKYHDREQDSVFIFIPNNFDLEASEICLLYKNRWEVELFKWKATS